MPPYLLHLVFIHRGASISCGMKFHTGKDSEQSLRQFAEKRAEFLTRELRDLNAEELKALLSTLKEDHRTFEQK